MTIGMLTGFAIPTQASNRVDHTYVGLSSGFVCGCSGRAAGGEVICAAAGNIDRAECLATPAGDAGIRYGVTGVCHQMANRILWPGGVTVLLARGARGSVFMWGLYGRDPLAAYSPPTYPWPELFTCLRSHAHP